MQNYLKSSFHPKESSEEGIHVKQRKYASDLLTFTHMFDAKLVDTKNKKKMVVTSVLAALGNYTYQQSSNCLDMSWVLELI